MLYAGQFGRRTLTALALVCLASFGLVSLSPAALAAERADDAAAEADEPLLAASQSDDVPLFVYDETRFASYQPPAGTPAPRAPAVRPGQQPPARQPPITDPGLSPQARAQSDISRSLGVARSAQSAAPYMIGDFFGGSRLQLFVQPPSSDTVTMFQGFGISQQPGNPNSPVFFTLSQTSPPILTSDLPGIDTNGDGRADTFPVSQSPPALTPLPPGPGNFTFVGGNLVFTGTGVPFTGRSNAPDTTLNLTHRLQPPPIVVLDVPSPSGGGGVGRVKIAENASPLPRDRVFHNFSYFDNVPLTTSGLNVSRFIPGFEKTFFDGIASVEMRFPMAVTLDSQILADGVTSTDEFEFGNLSIPLKLLLYADRTFAASIGLQIALPTADDTHVLLRDGTELLRIENEAVHLMPFVGALYTPNDHFFAQAFVQVDAEADGNPVRVTNFQGGLTPAGELDDPTLLFVDLSMGYWLFRNEARRGLTGVAPMAELHVNRSLEDPQVLTLNQLRVGNFSDRIATTNVVAGVTMQFGERTLLTVAYAAPVSDTVDDFDGELRVLFNYRFGPARNLMRAPY